MRPTKTALVAEIVVVLGLFVAVEWLASVLTNTRDNLVFGVLFWAVYLAVRLATATRKRPGGSAGTTFSERRDYPR